LAVPENSTAGQNLRETADIVEPNGVESLSSRLKLLGWPGIPFAIL
jgi:hypothetical protein